MAALSEGSMGDFSSLSWDVIGYILEWCSLGDVIKFARASRTIYLMFHERIPTLIPVNNATCHERKRPQKRKRGQLSMTNFVERIEPPLTWLWKRFEATMRSNYLSTYISRFRLSSSFVMAVSIKKGNARDFEDRDLRAFLAHRERKSESVFLFPGDSLQYERMHGWEFLVTVLNFMHIKMRKRYFQNLRREIQNELTTLPRFDELEGWVMAARAISPEMESRTRLSMKDWECAKDIDPAFVHAIAAAVAEGAVFATYAAFRSHTTGPTGSLGWPCPPDDIITQWTHRIHAYTRPHTVS